MLDGYPTIPMLFSTHPNIFEWARYTLNATRGREDNQRQTDQGLINHQENELHLLKGRDDTKPKTGRGGNFGLFTLGPHHRRYSQPADPKDSLSS